MKEREEVLLRPASCGEDHVRTDIHTAAHGGSHTRAGGYFLKEVWPMERTHAGAGEKC